MKRTSKYYLRGAVVAALLMLTASFAFPEAVSTAESDIQFLKAAAVNSAWKSALGKLASTQAASLDVKKYGEQTAKDHERLSRDLQALAAGRGATLSPEMGVVRQNTYSYLSQEYGAAFDRHYMSLLMDENQQDMALYGKEAEKGKDPEIASFAAKAVKLFESYVRAAEKILLDLPKPLLK